MSITRTQPQSAYSRAIGEHQNITLARTKKSASISLNYPLTRTKNKKKNDARVLTATLTTLACILLLTNDYCTDRIGNSAFTANVDFKGRCGNRARRCHNRSLSNEHRFQTVTYLQHIGAMLNTVTQLDFSLLPVAAAHTIPRQSSITAAPPRDDVVIMKIDTECADARETLSFPQIIRQIGKTLEAPITELAQESQVIHYWNTLQRGCPTPEDVAKLTAIAQRTDQVISGIFGLLPYATAFLVSQNVIGPLLQLIADDLEGRPIENDKVDEINSQILFLTKAVVDLSPINNSANITPDDFTILKHIQLKKNKVFTQIEGENWQLTYHGKRVYAMDNQAMYEVVYSQRQQAWHFFTHDEEVAPPELEEKQIETLTKLQIPQETDPHAGAPSDSIPQASPVPSDVNVPEIQPQVFIETRVLEPQPQLREEERRLGNSDSEASSLPIEDEHTAAVSNAAIKKKQGKPPSYLLPQPNTKIRSPLHIKLSKKLLKEVHSLSNADISTAGGLMKIVRQKHLPYRVIRRYISPSGRLTKSGRTVLLPHNLKMKTRLVSHIETVRTKNIERLNDEDITVNRPEQANRPANNAPPPEAEIKITKDAPATTLRKEQADLAKVAQSPQNLPVEDPHLRAQSLSANTIIEPDEDILRLVKRQYGGLNNDKLLAKFNGQYREVMYNLELNHFYLAERNPFGELERVSHTPYVAKAGYAELSEQIGNRVVTSAQCSAALKALDCHLDLTTIHSWLPQYQHYAEIPHTISSIWVGSKTIPEHLLKTLKNNAHISQASDHPYPLTLYLSSRFGNAYKNNRARLLLKAPSVNVVNLEETPFFATFAQSKYYAQYNAAIEGNGGIATNFASAADVLRFQLLKDQGGLYMDVDDTLISPPGGKRLVAPPAGFILSAPMSNEVLGMRDQFPTSIFGTHKDNPTLEKVSQEIHDRYQKHKNIYKFRPALEDHERFSLYAKKITHLTGPDVFDAVIKKTRHEEYQVLEAHRLWQLPIHDNLERMVGSSIMKSIFKVITCDIINLTDIVTVGDEHSWQQNRR